MKLSLITLLLLPLAVFSRLGDEMGEANGGLEDGAPPPEDDLDLYDGDIYLDEGDNNNDLMSNDEEERNLGYRYGHGYRRHGYGHGYRRHGYGHRRHYYYHKPHYYHKKRYYHKKHYYH